MANDDCPQDKPIDIWALDCPFRKTGSPVLGTMGSTVRKVIVFEYAEWKRFAALHPTIETQQFCVGTYDDG